MKAQKKDVNSVMSKTSGANAILKDMESIKADIEVLVGKQITVDSLELSYISGLSGEYRTLAIWQVALSQMIKCGIDSEKQEHLKNKINELSKELSDKEVTEYNSGKKYADGFGNIVEVKPKITQKIMDGLMMVLQGLFILVVVL